MKRVALLPVLLLVGCGSTAGSSPAVDAAGEVGDPAEAGAASGSIHLAWKLQRSDGSATDCITAQTNDIEVDVNTPAQVRVVSNTYYCVDMAKTVAGIAPGDYMVQLALFDATSSITALAGAAASVIAGAVTDVGTLTLVLPPP